MTDPIVIRTKVESDTLVLPELKALVGRTVAVAIVVTDPSDPLDDLIDYEYHARCSAELAADPAPEPTLDEVRTALSSIPGNWADEIIADREDQ